MFDDILKSKKCIIISPVRRTDEEAKIISDKFNINIYEAKEKYTWHEIDGKSYRFKFSDKLIRILNELIGPKIAKEFNLKTVNNIPAIMDCGKGLKLYGSLSENFIKKEYQYLNMYDLGLKNSRNIDKGIKNLYKLKKFCNKDDYSNLLNDIFKMTCLDYLMGQADRVASNFLFMKNNNKIEFAPLFDYSEAYECIKSGCAYDTYNNPSLPFSTANSFMSLYFHDYKFKLFLLRYPEFKKYMEIACDINIIKIINELEEEFLINVPEDYKYYYDVRTKEKQKTLNYLK